MKTPQLENGYIRIATEILDALIAYRLPGEQRQCLDFIIRKTYGFNKKEDCISNSQFVKATGLKKPNVCRAINGLIDKNVVIKKDNGNIPSYCFNKKYNSWKRLSKKITVIKKDNNLLSKKIPTKDNSQKIKEKIYKKERFKKPSVNQISEYCIERKNGINAQYFFDFYESKDWMIGKNRMKDWKAAIRTWENKNGNTRKSGRRTGFKDARGKGTDWLS